MQELTHVCGVPQSIKRIEWMEKCGFSASFNQL